MASDGPLPAPIFTLTLSARSIKIKMKLQGVTNWDSAMESQNYLATQIETLYPGERISVRLQVKNQNIRKGASLEIRAPAAREDQIYALLDAFCQTKGVNNKIPRHYLMVLNTTTKGVNLPVNLLRGEFESAQEALEKLLASAQNQAPRAPCVVNYTIVGPDSIVAEGHFNATAPS